MNGKTIASNMDTKFVAKVGRHPSKFVKLLRGASKEQVQSLVDATEKVLRKEIPVSSRLRNAIIEQRRFLRHLAHTTYSIHSKKRYLIQKGAGLGALAKGLTGSTRLLSGIGRAASMSRLPSVVRPLSRTAPLSRSLPSLAVAGGRPARVPSWSNLQQLPRSRHAAQTARAGRVLARRLPFGLSEVRDLMA